MAVSEDITLNLADPESIRAALPKAERVLREKGDAMIAARRDFEAWLQLVERLKAVVGEDPEPDVRERHGRIAGGVRTARRASQDSESWRYPQTRQAPRTASDTDRQAPTTATMQTPVQRRGQSSSGTSKGNRASTSTSPVQDRIVKVVEQMGRVVRPKEVVRQLDQFGIEYPNVNAVNSAMYAAYKAGKLDRPKKGYYAPKSWIDDGAELPVPSDAGETES